ncbi:MAG: hypothetical protein PHX14_13325 [Syntrophomonadaceae bacterium]|nr:hypothetical protein [Syntrophomonadaceae bacterium]
MRKCNLLSLVLCLILLLSLAGCNSSSSETNATKNANPVTGQADNKNSENANDAAKPNTPDGSMVNSGDETPADKAGTNGQMKRADLFGQVQSISGSKITLALAQKQQRSEQASQSQPPAQGDASQTQPPAQGEKPAGPHPGAAATPELTGETKTITVPDSAKIESGGRGSSQEIAIDKIKAGDMIEVFFNDAKADEIERVRVMQAPQD